MNSKVKIHMYMKEEKNYLYDWQKQSKTVYVDNKLISTIKRGENKEIELELEPGNHCITVEDANVLKTKTKQNFELKSDTTDCYVAFGYVKTIYSRFYKFCFLSLEQFNKNTFSNEQEKNVKLTVHRIHGFAQKKNYSVTIDDIETKKSAGEDIELYIAPGKHMIQYETVYTTAYPGTSFFRTSNTNSRIRTIATISHS